MASFPNLLSPLQARVIRVVADGLHGFFLTGGTALAAFHLGHRRSADLDFFTRQKADYETLVKQFVRLMESEGLTVAPGNAGPGFRRLVVSNGSETLPVDLVLDTTPALAAPLEDGNLVVDSIEDITANKLGAVLGRSEIRDYVDLYFIAQTGRDVLAFLPAAQRKDAGLDAATLAFVLSDVKVNQAPDGLERPLSADELRTFIEELRRRLARQAFPTDSGPGTAR